jgi:hypothetical protein
MAGPECRHRPEELLIVFGDTGSNRWLEQGDELQVRCREGISADKLNLLSVRGVTGG